MTQDMKKDTILYTGKGTYIHRLMDVCSSAYERMFIGSYTKRTAPFVYASGVYIVQTTDGHYIKKLAVR